MAVVMMKDRDDFDEIMFNPCLVIKLTDCSMITSIDHKLIHELKFTVRQPQKASHHVPHLIYRMTNNSVARLTL